MKNKNYTDKSAPYRTLSGGKIDAPAKLPKDEPRAKVIKGEKDLRSCKTK